MNRLKTIIPAIFGLLIISGCTAAGSAFVANQYVEPHQSQVIFYRPNNFVGSGVKLAINENDREVFRIQNGQFITHITDPGINVYSTKTLGIDAPLRLDLQPGETYYVRLAIRSGAFLNTLYLSRVYEEEALHELQNCCKSGD